MDLDKLGERFRIELGRGLDPGLTRGGTDDLLSKLLQENVRAMVITVDEMFLPEVGTKEVELLTEVAFNRLRLCDLENDVDRGIGRGRNGRGFIKDGGNLERGQFFLNGPVLFQS